VLKGDVDAKGLGRDHNPFGFTMGVAGGGFRPGMVHGAGDEFGYYAVETRFMCTTCTPHSCTSSGWIIRD
jgi:hypothetical protein